ncbi:Transcriptional regulator, AraC family [hydrothermal vent metagenome]|uniref:Transcriptional regulator, AraC family n=1 Tax=hydrothermal vent metagenome TaxID=652676 RepID=A0A1W1CRI0_9ZZZZ
MTYIVPNHFIDKKYKSLIKIDELWCLHYINKTKSDIVDARNTMHSMNILLEGSKLIHTKSEDIEIHANEIFFLTQNNYYMSERVTKDAKYKSMILYFDDKFVFDFIKKYKIDITTKESKNLITIDYKKDLMFSNTVRNFEYYLENKLDKNLLKLKIEEILLHAHRVNAKVFHSFINAVINTSQTRVLKIFESNIDIIQTVDDMCTLSRLSPSQLRRYVKKQTNSTPKVWLDKKRMEKARLMLKNTNKSITEISAESSYATVSWFISQFKKQYNQTPKEFRYKM